MDAGVAAKVCDVDGENACHAVNLHRRDESRVMNLHARDAMHKHKSFPLLIDSGAVRQSAEVPLK